MAYFIVDSIYLYIEEGEEFFFREILAFCYVII